MIGIVGGRPVSRDLLDRRVRELRDGPLRAALPAPGSSEDRQMHRWVAQVILTEELCAAEAVALGLAPVEGAPLDRIAAVELGSINASAYNGSPWVRAMYEHVAASAEIPSGWRAAPAPSAGARFIVRHRIFPDSVAAGRATVQDLEPLGAIELGSLPSAIADALRRQPYGELAGPVRDALGWHVATAEPAPAPGREAPDLVGPARRRAFAQWLDRLRAEKVELVPGLEHPGDPRQPDNHHKH